MTEKSPAFQFYPMDFLTDEKVVLMGLPEIGAYILLLCHAWLEGSIPDDPISAAKLCRIPPRKMQVVWNKVKRCWIKREDGRLINPRQEQERQKQREYRLERSSAGKNGAQKRWQSNSSAIAKPSNKNNTAMILPMAKNSSSSSTSSSTDTEASVTDSTVLGSNGELPPALIPLMESLRPHGQAIGKEPDIDLVRKIAEASLNQPLTAAAWIGKTWHRRFSERAVHRQPAPESLAYWVKAIREVAAGGWQS